jgi:hypothetical protein
MLGGTLTHEKIRRFNRRRNSTDLAPDPVQWRWALKQAAETLRLDVATTAIAVPPGIQAPTLVLYRRHYYRDGKGGKRERAFEDFESINTGAVLTIYLQVASSLPGKPNVKTPTKADVENIFIFIGHFIGLSPWGSNYDYGRFNVLELKALESIDEIPGEFYHR